MTIDEKLGRTALALSGGGSRAMAFHLGCLRALHKNGLLGRISIITSVSGGSVIAGLYCSYPGDFNAFDKRAHELLKRGFVVPALLAAITTTEGLKALVTWMPLMADRMLALLTRFVLAFVSANVGTWSWLRHSQIRRTSSRTTILRRALDQIFGGRALVQLRSDRPELIIIACELRAKAAFYFTARKLHCWRYGSASSDGVSLADAVSASAAYPVALPAIDGDMTFEKDGQKKVQRITLTDGGVYDNMGLAPLWPGRDPTISLDIGTIDTIIACRAGYALDVADPAATIISRMNSVFESLFARSQNLATNRMFELQRSGAIRMCLLPYLGQRDALLRCRPADLVTESDVSGYPTNFSAMSEEWIDQLSRRGEQLVLALIEEHWPKEFHGK